MNTKQTLDNNKLSLAFKQLSKLGKKKLRSFESHNLYDFGNNILYQLCKKYPGNKSPEIIITKTLFIGRIYSAALERTSKKKDRTAKLKDFYADTVVRTFRKLDLDTKINKLKEYKRLTEDNISDVISLYYYLLKNTYGLSKNKKYSFCSKYLHFHLPNLFYLYDSRASDALRRLKIKAADAPIKYQEKIKVFSPKNFDPAYKNYVLKCLACQEVVKKISNIKTVPPRHLDNILLHGYKKR